MVQRTRALRRQTRALLHEAVLHLDTTPGLDAHDERRLRQKIIGLQSLDATLAAHERQHITTLSRITFGCF